MSDFVEGSGSGVQASALPDHETGYFMRDLNDLVRWLEYGRESGYIAARCSKAQEENWANQLKSLLAAQEQGGTDAC